jgi:DNA-binding MarR family transcriptional regulator
MTAAATRPHGPDRHPPEYCALSEDLGWALGALSRSYVKAVAATFAEVPGGPRGYQVLAAAARDEHGSQLALAQHLGVDRTVMTYLLDSLAEVGLIERRPDPADRRARRIVATTHGRALLDELGGRLREAEDQVLAGLDEAEDRQAFRTLLQRLAVHAATVLDATAADSCTTSASGSC